MQTNIVVFWAIVSFNLGSLTPFQIIILINNKFRSASRNLQNYATKMLLLQTGLEISLARSILQFLEDSL